MASAVIRASDFKLVTEFAKPDSKKRLSLKDALGEALLGTAAFSIYRNSLGQVVLDPVKTVPVAEAWLHETPAALASVKRGLKEAAAGRLISRGSFSKHAKA